MKDSIFQPGQFDIMGHAINVIDLQRGPPEPFDAGKLFDRIILQHGPMIKMNDTRRTVPVGEPGSTAVSLQVPENVVVFADGRVTEAEVLSFGSGSEVDHALSINSSFAINYMGVSVTGSVDYSNSSNFKKDSLYAFQRFKHGAYTAKISDFDNFLNRAAKRDALSLPDWVSDDNQRSPAITQAYTNWFHRYGTHVIESVDYGWTFQVQIETSNFTGSSQEKLRAFVGVEYLQNKVDTAVLNTTDVSEYQTNSEVRPLVKGGDATAASVYQNDPQNADVRAAWFKSVAQKPDEALIDTQLKSIGDIFLDSEDVAVNKAGKNLNAALSPLQRICRRHFSIREVNVQNCGGTILSADCHVDQPTAKLTNGDNGSVGVSADMKSVSFSLADPFNSNSTFEFDIISKKLTQVTVHLSLDAEPRVSPGGPFGFRIGPQLVNSFVDIGRKTEGGKNQFIASTVVGMANQDDRHPGFDFTFDVKPELEYWWLPPTP